MYGYVFGAVFTVYDMYIWILYMIYTWIYIWHSTAITAYAIHIDTAYDICMDIYLVLYLLYIHTCLYTYTHVYMFHTHICMYTYVLTFQNLWQWVSPLVEWWTGAAKSLSACTSAGNAGTRRGTST